jgi:hypothetical protein
MEGLVWAMWGGVVRPGVSDCLLWLVLGRRTQGPRVGLL